MYHQDVGRVSIRPEASDIVQDIRVRGMLGCTHTAAGDPVLKPFAGVFRRWWWRAPVVRCIGLCQLERLKAHIFRVIFQRDKRVAGVAADTDIIDLLKVG